MSRRGPLRLIAALAFSLAACQATPTPTGSGPVGSTAAGSATAPGSTEPAGTSGVAPDLVTGDGDLFLDPIEGLAGLTSHRATLVWTFTGTADGQASTWSETTTFRTDTGTTTSELLVERTGVAGKPTRSWTALDDGVVFTAVDDEGCSAGLPDPARPAAGTEPAAQLSLLIGGVQTGTEIIDGKAADAFQFDGRAMGLVDPVKAVGHAWVSSADNLLLRLDVSIDGGPEYFGDGISGHLDGRYELGDVGAAVSLDIPAACPAGRILGPQPTDATNIESKPGSLSLQTAMTVKQAMAFYRDTSLAFGWKATADPVYQADPAVAGLTFSYDGLDLSVLITPADGGSLVEVTAHRA